MNVTFKDKTRITMPGISITRVAIGLGTSGGSWNPATPLAGETPNFWVTENSRSGLTLTDSVNSPTNDSSILPTIVRNRTIVNGPYVNAGLTSESNSVWVFKGRFNSTLTSQYQGVQDGWTKMFFFGVTNAYAGADRWTVAWGNGAVYSAGAVVADTDFHTFILYDKRLWIQPITQAIDDTSILAVISGVTPTLNASTALWTSPTTTFLYSAYTVADKGVCDIDLISSYIGTITTGVITWQRKHIFNNISYVFDLLAVSGNVAWTAGSTVASPSLYCSEYGSRQSLDVGYSRYILLGSNDIQVPYLEAGTKQVNPTLPTGYVWMYDVPAITTSHNLADSMIQFTGASWDRSDATIWSAAARAATTYYDSTSATTKKRWHISELNQLVMNSWANTNYKGLNFVKVLPNSVDVEVRLTLDELFSYTTNKTGSDITKIQKYTGDYAILQTPYLLDPYNDVLKVTALSDAEFKLNINNSILYTKQDLWDKIDAMVKLNPSEDAATTIMRYLLPNSNPCDFYFATNAESADFLAHLNCLPDEFCGPLSILTYNVFEHYYPGESFCYGGVGHNSNRQTNSFMELYMVFILYKGLYQTANFTEIIADNKIMLEPIRVTGNDLTNYNQTVLTLLEGLVRDTNFEVTSAHDNLSMKLPKDAYCTFPVLSANIPDYYDRADYNTKYANAIITAPTGKTGVVSMPFILTQITGTGTVLIGATTYTLPADEATVRALFQNGTRGIAAIYSYTILTNTGGIASEYLVNRQRLHLLHNNDITENIVSGDISVESVATATPLTTSIVSIDKGDADSWTLFFNKWITKNMSVRLPSVIDGTINLKKVTFNKTGGKIPRPIYFNNYAVTTQKVTAGASVTDQCFASKLTPTDDSFVTDLELTFTTYDASSCYYTLDGATPSAAKTLYTAPFTISATTTVKWINIKNRLCRSSRKYESNN